MVTSNRDVGPAKNFDGLESCDDFLDGIPLDGVCLGASGMAVPTPALGQSKQPIFRIGSQCLVVEAPQSF